MRSGIRSGSRNPDRPLPPARAPYGGDQHQHRRTHQTRRQRLSFHQDFLHQHGIGPVRKGGRGRHRGDSRHRPGCAHWAAVSRRGNRLRRLLLPQGPSRLHLPGGRARGGFLPCCRKWSASTNAAWTSSFARSTRPSGPCAGKPWAFLGLAFKAGTDDIREAVSLKIIQALLDEGSHSAPLRSASHAQHPARVFRPRPDSSPTAHPPMRRREGAQALLLLTEWEEFRQLDLARVRDLMEVPVLVDGRNLFDPDAVRQAGFRVRFAGPRWGETRRPSSRNREGYRVMRLYWASVDHGSRICRILRRSGSLRPLSMVTGGAGFLGSHLSRPPFGGGPRCHLSRQPHHRPPGEYPTSSRPPAFPLCPSRRDPADRFAGPAGQFPGTSSASPTAP